jgi:predicted lipid-binding transport protein (Tim44 family)
VGYCYGLLARKRWPLSIFTEADENRKKAYEQQRAQLSDAVAVKSLQASEQSARAAKMAAIAAWMAAAAAFGQLIAVIVSAVK